MLTFYEMTRDVYKSRLEFLFFSFFIRVEKQISRDPIQKKLDETTNLLQDLAKVQNARLSAKPPLHLGHTPGPSNEELQLGKQNNNIHGSHRRTPSSSFNVIYFFFAY